MLFSSVTKKPIGSAAMMDNQVTRMITLVRIGFNDTLSRTMGQVARGIFKNEKFLSTRP